MKVLLQVNTVVNIGSTGRIVEGIGQTALENGWNSHIAFGRNENKSKSNLIRIGTDFDLISHGLQTRLFDRHGLGSLNATRKLLKQIEKIRPDIIHLHNLHGYYLNVDVLINYLSSLDTPVVWTFHDCWPFTGHCTHFDFIGCNKWETECSKCIQKARYPASWLFDRSAANFRLKKKLLTSLKNLTIVPVSNWLAGMVKKSFFSNTSVQVINNGVDTALYKQITSSNLKEKHNLQGKFIILGVASMWDLRKGFFDFLELSKLLDDKSIILLIGLNAKQLHGLPNNVVGMPQTENVKELVEYYNIADVYCNTSKEETFGLTIIEALACGVPQIVYNSTACPELINKDTGYVVEKGNIVELYNAILKIKSMGKDYYSGKCIAHAARLYDKEDRFMDYIKLYEALLHH